MSAYEGQTVARGRDGERRYGVVVVGAGAAGLSGALTLGRARRSVLVIDDQEMAGHVIGRAVPADATGATAVPGVWVAGNVTTPVEQVVGAAAAGVRAAAAINADLIAEETRRAVAARRAPFSPQSEREVCERVLGDRRHGL